MKTVRLWWRGVIKQDSLEQRKIELKYYREYLIVSDALTRAIKNGDLRLARELNEKLKYKKVYENMRAVG